MGSPQNEYDEERYIPTPDELTARRKADVERQLAPLRAAINKVFRSSDPDTTWFRVPIPEGTSGTAVKRVMGEMEKWDVKEEPARLIGQVDVAPHCLIISFKER